MKMILAEARDAYYEFSKMLSEINRNLGFSGIALIWLFRETSQTRVIPHRLALPAFLIVSSLVLDFFQYVWATAAWGNFYRSKDKSCLEDTAEVPAPDWINWPTMALFWSKVGTMALAFFGLLRYLWGVSFAGDAARSGGGTGNGFF
jgi:hypothetical protein